MSAPVPIWKTRYNHPCDWDQDFAPLSLPAMLEESAAAHGTADLIDFMGRRYSYAETLDGANRVACGLTALGIGKGDRVGLFLPNVPHYLAAYYGALRIGATVVNFSPLYTVEELAHQVADSGTRILFTLSAKVLLPTALRVMEQSAIERIVVGSVAGVLPRGKSILYRLFKRGEVAQTPQDDPRVIRFSKLIDNDGACACAPIDPVNDVALIQYTGGTTGTPKGAMLTHQNLTANARQVDLLDPDPSAPDRIVGVLPFFHVFANTCVLNRTVHRGGLIAMLPRFDATQALALIERIKATALPGVPTMYQALLDHPKIDRTDFSSLRVCISGGAPLPAEVKARFEAHTGAKVVEGYGLTESSGVVSTNPYEGLNKPGTIGQPIPGTLVKLVDKEDPTRPPPQGQPGELVFSGPQVMKGYWNRPDADAEVFVGGFLRTGDVGEIDEDGYIRIVDRLKDMIAVGGYKVFPSQIEAILYRNPAVKEALVIGVPDAYHGEMPKAFVTLADGAETDGEALKAWLNPQLGKHERVLAVEVRLNLPKTLIGKLSRKELVAEEKERAAGT
ncbi:long-chain fatty acid--CoA ligase [Sphingomonas sp. LaA6.9]|uniref:long-chain-fatty-acid--CoA ligase n=1 Tax=Sphingomonas sp. LaA6.9 TaxID=2919914 RepID=UPI001F4F2295|nr:long-chain fatty acid--CoA ligase [Sphingomonas sp. LaA6.9]MCJ8157204.1 long-chain fatty acid--CoA ligase [Sphingomonas sp. LaA6.9]